MTYYYGKCKADPTQYGFYLSASDCNDPVTVTDARYNELMAGCDCTHTIAPDSDGNPVLVTFTPEACYPWVKPEPATPNRALYLDANGQAQVSNVSTTELNRLSGVTSDVQTQLNGKQASLSSAQMDAVNSGITSSILSSLQSDKLDKASLYTTSGANAQTSENPVALKGFVNSSVQTNTANFRGSWNTFADVPTVADSYPTDPYGNKTPTVNDYMVVLADENHSNQTWRYKYTGVWGTVGISGWVAEYKVNDTAFTQAQNDAINSGITSAKVTTYDGYASQIAGKEDTLNANQKRHIFISTAEPTSSDWSDGDIWLKYS